MIYIAFESVNQIYPVNILNQIEEQLKKDNIKVSRSKSFNRINIYCNWNDRIQELERIKKIKTDIVLFEGNYRDSTYVDFDLSTEKDNSETNHNFDNKYFPKSDITFFFDSSVKDYDLVEDQTKEEIEKRRNKYYELYFSELRNKDNIFIINCNVLKENEVIAFCVNKIKAYNRLRFQNDYLINYPNIENIVREIKTPYIEKDEDKNQYIFDKLLQIEKILNYMKKKIDIQLTNNSIEYIIQKEDYQSLEENIYEVLSSFIRILSQFENKNNYSTLISEYIKYRNFSNKSPKNRNTNYIIYCNIVSCLRSMELNRHEFFMIRSNVNILKELSMFCSILFKIIYMVGDYDKLIGFIMKEKINA